MKKRVLSVLLATTLVVMSLTGCADEATGGSEVLESKNESVQQSSEQATEVPTEAPTEAPTPEPTEEPTPEPTEAPVDWAAAYEGYFEREDILKDNFKMSTEVTEEGITFGMEIAASGNTSYMRYDFGGIALDLYTNAEKIYAATEMEGETSWIYTLVESAEDAEGLINMEDNGMVDPNSLSSYEYVEEVTEDGIIYDVLSYETEVDGETSDGLFYINRETQKMSRMIVNTEAEPAVFEITEIDGIEIPAEAEGATEATMDDVVGAIFGVMMMGALSGMEGMDDIGGEDGNITFEPADGVEIVEPETEVPDKTVTDDEWSTAYDNFFENEKVIPEKLLMTTSVLAEGIMIDLAFAQDGKSVMMTYDFGAVSFTLYADETYVYLYGETGDTEAQYVKALITSEAEVDELIGDSIDTSFDVESIVSQKYREAITEGDVIYDIIDVVVNEDGEESAISCFINRGTQYIEKMVMEQGEETMVCLMEELDAIEIPQEAKDAAEVTMEELEETMGGIMLVGIMMSMGGDLSALE